jgi:hypothetical protein
MFLTFFKTCVRRTKAFSNSEKNDDRITEHDRLTSSMQCRRATASPRPPRVIHQGELIIDMTSQ